MPLEVTSVKIHRHHPNEFFFEVEVTFRKTFFGSLVVDFGLDLDDSWAIELWWFWFLLKKIFPF